jgi:hypothetical protein
LPDDFQYAGGECGDDDMQDAELKALIKSEAASAAQASIGEMFDQAKRAIAGLQSMDTRLSVIENKLRGVLVASMASTMLPQIIANFFKDGANQKLEDDAVELAYRYATKIALRMEKEMGGGK